MFNTLPAPSTPREPHAVLLIHGLAGSPKEMRCLEKHLVKAGLSVHAPLLPGHGTTPTDLARTSWQDWYQVVRECFLDLSARYQTISVAGLCMGSLLALKLGREFGERINALSLISTTLAFDGWSIPWYRFLLPLGYHTPLRYVYSFPERPPYGIKNPRIRQRVASDIARQTFHYAKTPIRAIHQMEKLIRAVKKDIPHITAPACIIHATEDDITGPGSARYLERHLGSDRRHTLWLEDSYHLATIDTQRELVAQASLKFFLENSNCPVKRGQEPRFPRPSALIRGQSLAA